VTEQLLALAARYALGEHCERCPNRLCGVGLLRASGMGGGEEPALRFRRWRRHHPALRRPHVAAQQADVEVRLDATHAGHPPHRPFEARRFMVVGDLAVQEGDVVLHHHMDSRIGRW